MAVCVRPEAPTLDPESEAWLRADGGERDRAIERLHALLVRAARRARA